MSLRIMPLFKPGTSSPALAPTKRPISHPHLPAVALLLTGIFLSAMGAHLVRVTNAHMGETWLHDHASQIERTMSNRIEDYSNALIHTRALFKATGSVDPGLLRRYLADVGVLDKYPGTFGMNYISRVPAGKLKAFELRMRRSFPGFKVWPHRQSREYFPITFYEPENAENRRVIGFDTSLWPDRREAQARAVRTNLPTATNKITLVRDLGSKNAAGFVLFLPIFRPGAPVATPEQRENATIGMVATVFRVKAFLDAVVGNALEDSDISFEIYDGETTTPNNLFYRQRPEQKPGSGPHRVDQISVGGRTWTIRFYTGPDFGNFWSRQGHWIVMIAGTLVSLLFFGFLSAALRREEKGKLLAGQVRSALAARDEFISIAAHELRTPITSLKLQLDMARRYGSADPAKALARISQLGEQQVKRLTDLINELLDVTQIQSGRLRMSPRSADLGWIVRDIVENYHESLGPSGKKLELHVAEEPIMANADPLRLGQAVENLVSNALKYGGTSPIQLRVEKSHGFGVIRVRDFGAGIPPDRQDRIFHRFERLSDASDAVGSLGLGLYIAQQIVDAHQGKIRVQSEPGHGSTFSIELPLMAESAPGALAQ